VNQAGAATGKFARKQLEIVDAAIPVFTERGLGNTRLSDVAQAVGLKTTSITYYFKHKEDIAAAGYLRSVEAFKELAAAAQGEASKDSLPAESLFRLYFELTASIRKGERTPLMLFDEVLSLRGEHADTVFAAYVDMFKSIRLAVSGSTSKSFSLAESSARAHLLLSQLLWVPAWLQRYRPGDHARLAGRMFEIYAEGILPAKSTALSLTPVKFDRPQDAREIFLLAATETINSSGYQAASIDRIAEKLNLTKGSFYHHYNSKDELGLACLQRSFAVVEDALDRNASIENRAHCLQQTLVDLVAYQLDEAGPLLTAGAIRTLSPALRREVLDGYQRLSDRIADIVIDGISEGSLRPVDPLLASQMLTEAITAAHELPRWIRGVNQRNALEYYVRPLFEGAL
jgi:AcrR family transcriptional regulator